MNLRKLVLQLSVKSSIVTHIRCINCWSCGNNVSTLVTNLFCSNCNVLQKPTHENYFKLLGVSETFDLDENDLAKRYKELQKHLHPDKYANRYMFLYTLDYIIFLLSFHLYTV